MRQFTILIVSLICVFVCSCKKEPELEGMDYFNAHNYVFEQGDLLIQKPQLLAIAFGGTETVSIRARNGCLI